MNVPSMLCFLKVVIYNYQVIQGELNMDLLQEYKELYYKELELKDSMSGKIGSSITLITALCTGHVFLWDIMLELDFIIKFFPLLFLGLEVCSVIATVASMYYFYKTYLNYNYCLVSISDIKEAIDLNNSQTAKYTTSQIQEANRELLIDTFYTYAVENRKENLRKSSNQYKLHYSILIAIVFLILTYITWTFIINQFTF